MEDIKEKSAEETIDCIYNFENYYNYSLDETIKRVYSKEELKYYWFAENIIDIAFYDTDMAIKWGKLLYKTVKAILERKQAEIMEEMYEQYLICLNLIGIEKLDWGTSIRFCWFDLDTDYEERFKKIINEWKVKQ